jgi:hypothetical protein
MGLNGSVSDTQRPDDREARGASGFEVARAEVGKCKEVQARREADLAEILFLSGTNAGYCSQRMTNVPRSGRWVSRPELIDTPMAHG